MLALYLVLHIMEEPTGSGQLRHVNPVRKIPGTPCWREIFSKGRILGSSFACPFCIDKKDRTTLSYRCQPLICVDAQRLRIRQKIESLSQRAVRKNYMPDPFKILYEIFGFLYVSNYFKNAAQAKQ